VKAVDGVLIAYVPLGYEFKRFHAISKGYLMRRNAFSLIALSLGLLARLLFLSRIPGLHFDEAWAADFAHRIAVEPGFWPFDAMSPYTHPWSHDLTAIFFKIFGTNLLVSRLAGLFMSVGGLVLVWRALVVWGEENAAVLFSFLAAMFVPSILNERFAIEINTFLVLCLGGLVYGISRRSWPLIFVAAVVGVTSHILFLAPLFAAFLVWAAESRWRKRDRFWIAAIALALLPFFCNVFLKIPEKDKASALIFIDMVVVMSVVLLRNPSRWIFRLRKPGYFLAAAAGSIFLLYACVIAEGHASILFTYGRVANPWLLFLTIPTVALFLVYILVRVFKYPATSLQNQNGLFFKWTGLTLLLVGLMSTKPAPRYFEIAFVLILAAIALILSRAPRRQVIFLMILMGSVSFLQLGLNYMKPGLMRTGVDRSYRYLYVGMYVVRDNSSDSLSKQDLVEDLGAEGCSFSDVRTEDSRLYESLRFLSFGDWNVSSLKRCPSGGIEVERSQWVDEGGPLGLGKRLKRGLFTWIEKQ
jgi:hypothetical protein